MFLGKKEKMVFFGVEEEGIGISVVAELEASFDQLATIYDKISESHC